MPIAVYCKEKMLLAEPISAVVGITTIDASSGCVTVNEAVAVLPGMLAVIVAAPGATLVTIPFDPVVVLIVATLILEDAQLADSVIFCVVPSV